MGGGGNLAGAETWQQAAVSSWPKGMLAASNRIFRIFPIKNSSHKALLRLTTHWPQVHFFFFTSSSRRRFTLTINGGTCLCRWCDKMLIHVSTFPSWSAFPCWRFYKSSLVVFLLTARLPIWTYLNHQWGFTQRFRNKALNFLERCRCLHCSSFSGDQWYHDIMLHNVMAPTNADVPATLAGSHYIWCNNTITEMEELICRTGVAEPFKS